MNNVSFEKELRNTFITESKEMLDETETIFINLEKNPNDFSHFDKLLRIIHTIKGSAAVVGIEKLVHFTHVYETLLISVKNNKTILSQEIIDILIAGNDSLKKSMDIIEIEPKSELAHFNQIKDSIEKILNIEKKDNSVKNTEKITTSQPIENVKSIGNVLILDDEKEILEYMKIIIEQQNYHVYAIDNAQEALDVLNTKKIDVIFTDLKMPKMDGFQFTEKIRKINKYIPIILVSGNLDLESSKKFLKLGVNDFIDKPFNTNNLLFVLERAMKTKYIWNELLKISKACFKTYVYFQKMDSFINNENVASDILKDREILKNCLDEIKETTINILDFEKSKAS